MIFNERLHFMSGMDDLDYRRALLEYLGRYISDNKKALFEQVIGLRTRYITVVLEDLYQPQNASAVLRTCECFGIQEVNIIENQHRFKVNPKVVIGASKWITVKKFSGKGDPSKRCIEQLRSEGYRIVATSPAREGTPLERVDVSAGKMAIIIGSEEAGLSRKIIDMADEQLFIPMFGFTESFNVSVATAIILAELLKKVRGSGVEWRLDEDEKLGVLLGWARKVVRRFPHLEKKFASQYGQGRDILGKNL